MPSSDFRDAVDVLKSMIHSNGTEWDLVFVDYKVSISELLMYVWICALKGSHLGKVKWNQPSILLLVISKEVLPQSIEGRQVQLPKTITGGTDECIYGIP